MKTYPVHGAGLGLRRDLLNAIEQQPEAPIDFMEVAPENWIGVGGRLGKRLRALTERTPFVFHGLSLSIGGPAPLDEELVGQIKALMHHHHVRLYSEHLSYCSDDGHLYDLMPIPFTTEAVHHVAARIRRVQDILERRMAVENVSYYTPAPGGEMAEIDFINAVLEEADCDLLLDVNNIYVNSVNHGYDALDFLRALPAERVVYFHVAGHYQEAEDLIVDTHGAGVVDPVWRLLDEAYAHCGPIPTLLERDFNIPPLATLLDELSIIRGLQQRHHAEAAGRIKDGTHG